MGRALEETASSTSTSRGLAAREEARDEERMRRTRSRGEERGGEGSDRLQADVLSRTSSLRVHVEQRTRAGAQSHTRAGRGDTALLVLHFTNLDSTDDPLRLDGLVLPTTARTSSTKA